MSRILCNFDVASLYPNLIRIFGYSSRNQKDVNKYVETLKLRMDAKYNRVSEDMLLELDVTNDDLKGGLKLPINAYSGALRATFNALYDPVQGFSICTTGQLLILQLIHDLQKIPTLEMVSANTDAVMFTIEEEHKQEAVDVLHEWEKLTQLELEEDKIVKIIMRDVNNYCEIVQVGDNDYKVNYKGGEFKGKHKFKWNKEKKTFEYSFDDEIEANSLTIISEALLKNLLFSIPIEKTILECDDIFRFQMITHLGSTYEKMVQESENGDILLQRNNRVYAGKKPSGMLIKVKYDGRRDSLAQCPSNPIVDNANECTIVDIDKSWYIRLARQKLNDFKGVKRLTEYKKEELLEKAIGLGLEVDKKMKKADIVKMLADYEDTLPVETLYPERIEVSEMEDKEVVTLNIYEKLNKIKAEIKEIDFVMDSVMPTNLGGREYPSVGQYYRAINDACMRHNVFFEWEVLKVSECQRELFKPTGKMPQHVWDVWCMAVFTNIDNPEEIVRTRSVASGSDMCDKGISGGSALAFRNWFDKNFTPKYLTDDDFDSGDTNATEEVKTSEPKIPTYIPPEKKEEIKKEVIATEQHEESDKDDIKEVIDNIMKVRELINNPEWGAVTLESLMNGNLQTADILAIKLKVDAKLESVEGAK